MNGQRNVAPVVEMRGITIAFPGVLALDGVDFELRPGEIHSLMGENGAGKSTLIKALTGVYSIDSGSIQVGGEQRTFTGAADAQSAGISTVYQEVNLCPNLSVGENVMLGHEMRGRLGIDWSATHREAVRRLADLGLELDSRSLLGSHSIAVQQLVAISRAMVLDARVLILDEPTSSLDRQEVDRLFDVIRGLRAQGVAILFVSHFLDQVYEISDCITVLRNGQLVGEFRADRAAQDGVGDKDDRSSACRARRDLGECGAGDRPHRAPRSTGHGSRTQRCPPTCRSRYLQERGGRACRSPRIGSEPSWPG